MEKNNIMKIFLQKKKYERRQSFFANSFDDNDGAMIDVSHKFCCRGWTYPWDNWWMEKFVYYANM